MPSSILYACGRTQTTAECQRRGSYILYRGLACTQSTSAIKNRNEWIEMATSLNTAQRCTTREALKSGGGHGMYSSCGNKVKVNRIEWPPATPCDCWRFRLA